MFLLPLQENRQYLTADGQIVGPLSNSQYLHVQDQMFCRVDGMWRAWWKHTGKRVYDGHIGDIVADCIIPTPEEMYKAVML